MPLLTSTKQKSKHIPVHLSVQEDLLNEVKAYAHWAGMNRPTEFILQAIQYVLKNDREWNKFRSAIDSPNVTDKNTSN